MKWYIINYLCDIYIITSLTRLWVKIAIVTPPGSLSFIKLPTGSFFISIYHGGIMSRLVRGIAQAKKSLLKHC